MARRGNTMMELIQVIASFCMRTLVNMLRWRVIDGYKDYEAHQKYPGVIWVFWHGQLLFPTFIGRYRGIRTLISHHRDGEIVARVSKSLGIEPIRGSTSRDGIGGLMDLVKVPLKYDIAIAPDGPRGPREVVQPGVIYLAQVTGRAIMPLMCSVHPCIRLKSWDRFIFPLPYACMSASLGNAITVPRDASAKDRERLRLELEEEMKRMTRLVEAAAREDVPSRRYAKHHHPYCAYDKPFATDS